jgi:hypothetical protein
MATENYPTGLPDHLLASQARQSTPASVQSNPVKGPPVNLKWTDDQPDVWNVTWRMSNSQLRAFDAWKFNNLKNGTVWFNILLPVGIDTTGEQRSQEANFMGSIPSKTKEGAFNLVSVVLTVRGVYRDTQEFTDSYLDLIANGDEPVATLAALEQLVNVDLAGIA